MKQNEIESYPLSKKREIRGNRRLVREKILQVLVAFELSGTELDVLYSNIFFRDFSYDPQETVDGKLLTNDEIFELESDVPIKWKNDEIEFARGMMNNCIELRAFTEKLIQEEVANWELDRLALIDKTLILMATVEFLKFPHIPTKVTINEILDIAKNYSTEKSHIFINGILDSFQTKFIDDGTLVKTGKGLITQSSKPASK